ncbi:hypothetical protein [Reinekea blandensis]|uniref:Uncharacterized protein n=1 Tax=Reinekea blandensis MED297 TaxID=314283 RepID=A4BBE6_9GAMM|nr:hypothetical protein [Reinekea blandensis]EAR10759.1 hypothetical protein MED297_12105 [Reinekea sp. MED297] [Reinekea blandensis MED297]
MSQPPNKPKWQKHLRKLLKGKADTDREALQTALTDLRRKAVELEARLAQAESNDEAQRLKDKLELIQRHLKKGEARLVEWDDQKSKGK